MQIQAKATLFALVLLSLAGCESKDARSLVVEAGREMGNRHYADALSNFDTALDMLTPADEALRKEALLGRCAALAWLDGPVAQTEFLKLAESGKLGADLYSGMAQELAESGYYGEAIAILEHGMERFPNKAILSRAVQKVGDMSKAAKTETNSAMDDLKRLGYVGGDGPEEDEPDGNSPKSATKKKPKN